MDFKSENMLSKWLQATRKEYNDDEGFKAFIKTMDFRIKLDPEKIEELSGFNKIPDCKTSKKEVNVFSLSDMKDFAAFVLYYSANPKSTMCIPNVVYEQIDRMWKNWLDKK